MSLNGVNTFKYDLYLKTLLPSSEKYVAIVIGLVNKGCWNGLNAIMSIPKTETCSL